MLENLRAIDEVGVEAFGQVLEQPQARGTAVGVFWPLAQVISRASEAIVLILPSDHFFYPERQFVAQLRDAVDFARAYTNRIILVGAVADAPETDYGWIEPGRCAKPGGMHLIGTLNRLATLNRRRLSGGEQPYASAHPSSSPRHKRSLLKENAGKRPDWWKLRFGRFKGTRAVCT
jgi:hypothetical protein